MKIKFKLKIMKKIILILSISFLMLSCSKEDSCETKKSEINATYDIEIIKAGNDQRKIAIINQERFLKLSSACK